MSIPYFFVKTTFEAQGHRGGTEARGEQIRRGQDVFRRPAIMKASEPRRSRQIVGSVGYASPALDVPAEATESYGLRDGFWVEFWGGTDLVLSIIPLVFKGILILYLFVHGILRFIIVRILSFRLRLFVGLDWWFGCSF